VYADGNAETVFKRLISAGVVGVTMGVDNEFGFQVVCGYVGGDFINFRLSD